MNIFITGAAGYIGQSIDQRLFGERHTIRGLVRDPTNAVGRACLPPVAEVIRMSQ